MTGRLLLSLTAARRLEARSPAAKCGCLAVSAQPTATKPPGHAKNAARRWGRRLCLLFIAWPRADSLRRMFLMSHSTLKYSTLLWTHTTARAGQAGPHNCARQGRPDLLAAVPRAVGGERAGRGVHALRDRRAQVRGAAARVPCVPGRQPLAALVDHPSRLCTAAWPPLQRPAGTPVQVEARLGSRLPHQSLQAKVSCKLGRTARMAGGRRATRCSAARPAPTMTR